MSFQTFVTERLAAITAQLNAIATNAKKIFELPVQSTLDPSSKIHVSRGGISESLEIQKIIDAITEKNYSQLLEIGEITVSGLDVIVPSGAMWVYEGVIYQTIATTTLSETLCAAGFLRKDILVGNQSNEIILVKGIESETIRISPSIPLGCIFISEIDVDDTVIGAPSTPIIGDIYLKKEYYTTRIASGETGIVDMPQERTRLYLYDCTFLEYLIWGDNPLPYHGMDFFVSNNNVDHRQLTIKHLSGSETGRFSFPDGQDMILQYGELLHFKMQMPSRTMEYVGTDYKKADKSYVDAADSELQIQVDELKAKTDSDNNFKVIPDPGYTFNTTTRVLTMNAGWIGTINGVDYTNLAPQPFTAVPLAASGYSRIDLIVFKTDTTFERIAGVESTFTPVAPAKPTNTLQATFLTIGDGEIIVPVTPKPKAPVTSVNGKVGAVVLTIADISGYNEHFKGVYVTLAALNSALPTASIGDYAQVNEVGGTDVLNYNWDNEESIWVAGGGTGGAANTDALPEGSTNLYWTVARFLANLTAANIKAALGITTLSGSNTGDQDLSGLQPKDTQVEVSSNTNVLDAWNGKTLLFTANCTVTVPATLMNSLMFVGRTLAGVTVTWAITAPFTWETTPTTTTEKKTFSFIRRGSTNTILLDS